MTVAVGGSLAHQKRRDTITWNQATRNHIDMNVDKMKMEKTKYGMWKTKNTTRRKRRKRMETKMRKRKK